MTPLPRPARQQERGAALLTVLLLVATMSIIAAMTLERLTLATRVSGQGSAIVQARAYAMAMEQIAGIRIGAMKARSQTLSADGWQGKPFTVPMEGGRATASLYDAGNCFNLNSVVQSADNLTFSPNSQGIAQFAELMRLLNIPGQDAAAIAAATSDWIDSDTMPQIGGAEDDVYRGLASPYLPANTMMAEPSELRAVRGVTPQIYTQLRPYICALPVAKPSLLNVNTMLPEQAPLLAMLAPGYLDLGVAREQLAARPQGGWSTISAFWASGRLAGFTPPRAAEQQLRLTSRWFRLETQIALGESEVTATALLDADTVPVTTARRIWGEEE